MRKEVERETWREGILNGDAFGDEFLELRGLEELVVLAFELEEEGLPLLA